MYMNYEYTSNASYASPPLCVFWILFDSQTHHRRKRLHMSREVRAPYFFYMFHFEKSCGKNVIRCPLRVSLSELLLKKS